MNISIIGSIDEVGAEEWNALRADGNPFLRHEFLSALERHRCVGHRFGWIPQHIIVRNNDHALIGAAPMYLKDNSYGEFVFDWSWADAYHRHGLHYYPKLVVSIPYTPATGPRILTAQSNDHENIDHKNIDHENIEHAIISAALEHAKQLQVSSLHWLFTDARTTDMLERFGFLRRVGCQFHWHNAQYKDFDEFLATFSSSKRKQIKRERRKVSDAHVKVHILSGHDMNDILWKVYHRYYQSTFARLGGHATLSLDFFREIGASMADNIVLTMAEQRDDYVAAAFCLRGSHALYGRHWGCSHEIDGLHFEACYYQGIDYCIQHNLQLFEPGAQGEHKISRGFLPTATYSAHWIAHPQFRSAIGDFLAQESRGVQHYINSLMQHSPYKALE